MRAPFASASSRPAATALCAVCRREAIAALASRRATSRVAASQSLFRTASTPTPPSARRWASSSSSPQSHNTSASTDPASSSSSSIPPYYALFPETLPDGPPPKGKFDIDLRALRREFLRLQAASHPDFHHSAASLSSLSSSSSSTKSAARLRAEAASAQLNAAYRTLCSPLLRAQYLLRAQHGVDLEADDEQHAAADPEVLMTVLEAREAIDEARREEDLAGVREANEARIREAEGRVGELLERGDVKGAREEAVRLRYWMGVREGLDNWERGGGGGAVLQH